MKILFLDDDENRHKLFKKHRHPRHKVTHVFDVPQAIAALGEDGYDLICLDHDLGGHTYCDSDENSGYAVAKHIAELPKEKHPPRVVVHSWNETGAWNMVRVLSQARVRSQWTMFATPKFWEFVE